MKQSLYYLDMKDAIYQINSKINHAEIVHINCNSAQVTKSQIEMK